MNKLKQLDKQTTISVSEEMMKAVGKVIAAELVYEKLTNNSRHFGITGEIGEVLVCKALNLNMVKDPRSAGYDAIDKDLNRIQIKTRRSEKENQPKKSGRLGSFSRHDFEYALLAILGPKYELIEIRRASYLKLKPLIEKLKRSNPSIISFCSVSEKIY